MRASTLRQTLADAVVASAVDGAASGTDRFAYRAVPFVEDQPAPERTFTIQPVGPSVRSRRHYTQDEHTMTFECAVAYTDAPEVIDRITDDSERVSQALEGVPGVNADIHEIFVDAGTIAALDKIVISTFVLTILYRLDSGV